MQPKCGYTSSFANHLRRHLKTHIGEEKHKNSYKNVSLRPDLLSLDQLKLRQELELLCRSKKGAFQVSFDQECSCLLNPSPNLKLDVVVFMIF